MPRFRLRFLFVALLALFITGSLAQGQTRQEAQGPIAHVTLEGGSLTWRPHMAFDGALLSLSGPVGVQQWRFAADETISLSLRDAQGQLFPAGEYTYELRLAPIIDQQTRDRLSAATEDQRAAIVEQLQRDGKLPAAPLVQTGSFAIVDGEVLFGSTEEQDAGEEQKPAQDGASNGADAPQDQVINDDLIVKGSSCVGFDCQENESFGADTIRLKENNLRIKFEDTSDRSGFPTTDWQITANDSTSGGLNKFSIEDVTASRIPFTIRGTAPTDSLYVSDLGQVGLGTSTPVLDLHIFSSNTPAVRLDQDPSGGWGAYTWDVAGNEANFFVRDVTGGSKLPFRIRPGAPTNSLYIESDGSVGLGTRSPEEQLHVAGNVLVEGNIYEHSDATVKERFTPVSPRETLERLMQLQIMTWNYKAEDHSVRHMGPTAQDFHAAFGLGASDRYIAPLDTNGVALSAIQGLYQLVQDQQSRIEELERDNAELEQRLERLEDLVRELSEQ